MKLSKNPWPEGWTKNPKRIWLQRQMGRVRNFYFRKSGNTITLTINWNGQINKFVGNITVERKGFQHDLLGNVSSADHRKLIRAARLKIAEMLDPKIAKVRKRINPESSPLPKLKYDAYTELHAISYSGPYAFVTKIPHGFSVGDKFLDKNDVTQTVTEVIDEYKFSAREL